VRSESRIFREQDLKTAVVSSSRNCAAVLEAKRETVTPSPLLADPGSTRANERLSVLPVREQKANDPLANVKQRQAKRPAFDYKPELADPKDLI